MIRDAADLFAAEGEGATDVLDNLKTRAQDALDLLLAEAPDGSRRERYNFVREQVFPLLLRIGDGGERCAALDDVAAELGLRKTDLRKALADAIEGTLQDQEELGRDDEEAEEDLAPEPGTERHERAMGLLRCPDVLEAAARDMERLGHVGEPTAKKLLFICAVSAPARLAIQPSIHAESSAGKNALADVVLSLVSPERVIRRSAISAKALYRTEESLAGRILYLQEHAGSEDADFTFRVMQSDGKLIYEATEQGPDGSFRTVVREKEGPLVIIQTTTELRLFDENATRVFGIYLDESAQQTGRVVRSTLRDAATGGVPETERRAIIGRWHDAIRLLEVAKVMIPYAERIDTPNRLVRMRRDVPRLLDVIRIRAWLHQHTRERDNMDRILAMEADFQAALELVSDPFQRAWKSLTPAEEAVLNAARSLPEAIRKTGFTRNDLAVEGQSARRVQENLKSLSESGYIERDRRGGSRGYRYTMSRDIRIKGLGIVLRPPGDAEGGRGASGAEPGSSAAQNHGAADEGASSRGPRAVARETYRAPEGPDSPAEDDSARSRGAEDELGKEPVDYPTELAQLGWYRAETVFTAGPDREDPSPHEDPLTRGLRHRVGVYQGELEPGYSREGRCPWIGSAEDTIALATGGETGEEPHPAGSAPAPAEAPARLRKAVTSLQMGPRRFTDHGLIEWYGYMEFPLPPDPEKLCKEAHLHAELWRNEGTSEELWVLVALRENWRPPEEEIERAMWMRVTGRSEEDEFGPDDSGSDFESDEV